MSYHLSCPGCVRDNGTYDCEIYAVKYMMSEYIHPATIYKIVETCPCQSCMVKMMCKEKCEALYKHANENALNHINDGLLKELELGEHGLQKYNGTSCIQT